MTTPTADQIARAAARALAIQDQIKALNAERAELDKVLAYADPQKVYRGYGARLERTPVHAVDKDLVQKNFPISARPDLYQTVASLDLARFKKEAGAGKFLAQYQTVSYRTTIKAEDVAYSAPADDDEDGF